MNGNSRPTEPTALPLLFLAHGRRGATPRFTLELANAALETDRIDANFAISSASELRQRLTALGTGVFTLPTFAGLNPVAVAGNYRAARRELLARLQANPPAAVVTVMPHVWTPLLAPAIRQMGIRYATIVHDVAAHPGDVYGVFARWLLREAHMADLAITLSDAVAEQLVGRHQIPNDRVLRLFHPDLEYDGTGAIRRRSPDRPLRLLFFGRIMAYKGLTLLIDAVEMLRRQGIHVHLGVAGSGRIGPEWRRLAALDAEIVNRWIDDSEVGALLSRYDAVAAAHVEASQSGVVAAAFGHRLPVVAMPVGGIPEQVIDGRTGVLAPEIGAAALASAIRRLAVDPGLYDRISAHLHETAAQRSMALFVDKLAARLGQSA